MLSPLTVSPLETLYPICPSPASEAAPIPIHPHQPPHPGVPLHWGIKSSQEKEPFLQLIPDKAILCYVYSWNHGSFHVYSLVYLLEAWGLVG